MAKGIAVLGIICLVALALLYVAGVFDASPDFRVRRACDEAAPAFAIDMTMTWVNSSTDADWCKTRDAYRGSQNNEARLPSESQDPELELRHALRLALKHAPFVRVIWLVTMRPQVPACAAMDPRIRVVHHDDFMPADLLPVFNSSVIEDFLHFIPGLAEHYLMMNDDFYILRPTPASAYFTSAGQPLVRFSDRAPRNPVTTLATMGLPHVSSYFQSYDRCVDYCSHQVLFLDHTPRPLTKSIAARRLSPSCEEFRRAAARNRFRRPDDFMNSAVMLHHALRLGDALLADKTYWSAIYKGPPESFLPDLTFACVNSMQAGAETEERLSRLLDQY